MKRASISVTKEYRDGRRAYYMGLASSANPHEPTAYYASLWDRGWIEDWWATHTPKGKLKKSEFERRKSKVLQNPSRRTARRNPYTREKVRGMLMKHIYAASAGDLIRMREFAVEQGMEEHIALIDAELKARHPAYKSNPSRRRGG